MSTKKSTAKKAAKIQGVGSVADAAALGLAVPDPEDDMPTPEQAAEIQERFARSFENLKTVRREPAPGAGAEQSGGAADGGPVSACPFGGAANCPHAFEGVCPHEPEREVS